MRFYNRGNELRSLQKLGRNYLIVLWGRRRIGKTSLALHGFPDALYFFVSRKSSGLLLEEFTGIVRNTWKYVPTFSNWEEFFRFLFAEYDGTIVMDEFQNFRFADRSVFSTLQKVVDSSRYYRMVAIGSYVGMMKHIFMDAKEPLYGRATGILKVHPLAFSTIHTMLEDLGIKDFEEKLCIYSIFGGVPYYYTLMENYGTADFPGTLERLIFSQIAPLKYEVKNILLEEFGRNYTSYFSILQSIARGKSTLTEIADKSGIGVQSISKYLKELAELYALIERVVPIDGGRRGIYRIQDPFTRFWFRYVERHLSEIEGGHGELAMEQVLEERNMIASWEFETIVRDLLKRDADLVGKWWNRQGEEIDAVAANSQERTVTFGEVKWTGRKIGEKELTDLRAKTEKVKGFKGYAKNYLLVSKGGFRTRSLGDDVITWDLRDVERMAGEFEP